MLTLDLKYKVPVPSSAKTVLGMSTKVPTELPDEGITTYGNLMIYLAKTSLLRKLCPQTTVPMTFVVYIASDTPPRVDTTGNTRDALPQAKAWLTRCTQSHPRCKRTLGFLSTRLVSTKLSSPRLCIGDNLLNVRHYATLSHCWGQSSFTTLTTDAISSFKTEIPASALSSSIKDAIEIAATLDIFYIWIDTRYDWNYFIETASVIYYLIRFALNLTKR
ncbi:HET-domain-containing protein [Pyrenophora tritici-repentis]|nr:HET-domain-containing protein [Pyrenophora tritici-repentis]KAI0583559.1 HET-domain-containing protein [Pyrenophora tritici-repentis]